MSGLRVGDGVPRVEFAQAADRGEARGGVRCGEERVRVEADAITDEAADATAVAQRHDRGVVGHAGEDPRGHLDGATADGDVDHATGGILLLRVHVRRVFGGVTLGEQAHRLGRLGREKNGVVPDDVRALREFVEPGAVAESAVVRVADRERDLDRALGGRSDIFNPETLSATELARWSPAIAAKGPS